MKELYVITYEPIVDELGRCQLILKECVLTLNSLLSIHNEIKSQEEKEDLLRAMFIFATGGLDSLFKQAIKDTLSNLIEGNEGANNMFQSFAEKEIQEKKTEESGIDSKLIAKLLTSTNPRKELKERLIYNLTSNSLQSKDQILRIAAYFDIPSKSIVDDVKLLQDIFIERNKIIHEMDINFDGDKSRNRRELKEIVQYVNYLLKIGEKLIIEIEKRM